MPSLINPVLQEEFLREGFVTMPLLDPATVSKLRDEVTAAYADDWKINHEGAGNYLSVFDDNRGRKGRIADAVSRTFYPPLADHLQDYKILVNTLFAKPPSSPGTPLHQHAPISERPFETAITVWCALTDCDADTSALFVVPRSHQLYRFLRVYGHTDFFHDYRETMVDRHIRRLTFKAGDALIMDNNLIHGAFGNRGSGTRLAVAALLIDTDSRFMVYRREADQVLAMDPAGEPPEDVEMMVVAPTGWTGPVHKRFPAWNTHACLEQTEALLKRAGARATEVYDPLTTVAGLVPPPPRTPFDWRASARKMPGAVQAVRLARRALSGRRNRMS